MFARLCKQGISLARNPIFLKFG